MQIILDTKYNYCSSFFLSNVLSVGVLVRCSWQYAKLEIVLAANDLQGEILLLYEVNN